MYFVGREKEIGQIKEALQKGKNLIVSGKYGMGRTRLIKHIAESIRNQWRFVFADFSATPGAICHHLVRELFPGQEFGRGHMRYRSSRFRIATRDLGDKRKHLLVFDNIAKLSPQKLDLIRYFAWEKRFQFVAIVESFIAEDHLLRLRGRLYPAETIMLQYLGKKNVCKFYRHLSEQYGLRWTEGHIKNLTDITGGYPLRMTEIARRELGRK